MKNRLKLSSDNHTGASKMSSE